MISYIINTTVIWLVSLVVFDLAMRRSTHHAYNRTYLIITASLGALLPLYHGHNAIQLIPALAQPLYAAADVKRSISAATAASAETVPWTLWLAIAYSAGIILSAGMLLRDALILYQWYRGAERERLPGGITLIVTQQPHTPFSVLRCIFISNKALYSAAELQFIMQHEGVHIRRRHGLDKTLLLLMRCIFWAHPLPYIYYRRLMMVHEYEADNTARAMPGDYSRFLLDQHLAGATPQLAHSFFHSPLKNRIRMLQATRSRGWRKAAHFIALPAIAAFAILWVNDSAARKRVQHGNVVEFGANKFEMGLPDMDGKPAPTGPLKVVMGGGSGSHKPDRDAATPRAATDKVLMDNKGATTITFTLTPMPLRMNGEKIYDDAEVSSKGAMKAPATSLMEVLVNDAGEALSALPDGRYRFGVRDIIIDKGGHIVYYDIEPVSWYAGRLGALKPGQDFDAAYAAFKKEQDEHPIPEETATGITAAIERSLDGLQLTPATKDGAAVISKADFLSRSFGPVVMVKNHQVSVETVR